jgi:aryl-alcohol dehydrogenase-like predicted oxidoreductase
LAYGLLGGKYQRGYKLPENDWRHRSGAFDPGVYEKNLDVVDALKAMAEKKQATPSQLAIRWLLSKPAVCSVIAGAKRVEQLEQNIGADSVELSTDELAQIDAVAA